LIEAEGGEVDRPAPFVKLALALTLAHRGVSADIVEPDVREALALNPLLAPPEALADAEGQIASLPPAGWSMPLNYAERKGDGTLMFHSGQGVRKLFYDPAKAHTAASSVAVARDAVTGRGYIILRWTDPIDSVFEESWLAAFDLADGSVLWCQQGRDAEREIVLAAPSVVVLRRVKPANSDFEVVNARDGSLWSVMSPMSFKTLYWPRWPDRRQDTRYTHTHVRLSSPAEVRSELAKRHYGQRSFKPTSARRTGSVCDPLSGSELAMVTAANTFSLVNEGTSGQKFYCNLLLTKRPIRDVATGHESGGEPAAC
jgi:hypothetical protein